MALPAALVARTELVEQRLAAPHELVADVELRNLPRHSVFFLYVYIYISNPLVIGPVWRRLAIPLPLQWRCQVRFVRRRRRDGAPDQSHDPVALCCPVAATGHNYMGHN